MLKKPLVLRLGKKRNPVPNKKGYNQEQAQSKVNTVMSEFKDKKLHSGRNGPIVTNRRQAVAIAMSESGQPKKKKKKTSDKLKKAVSRKMKKR